jgi:hypothetical protein
MPGKIFVNYLREDAGAEAGRLRDRLTTVRAGNVFMDIDDLKPGQRFDQALANALKACTVFLAVIGARWCDLAYARAQWGANTTTCGDSPDWTPAATIQGSIAATRPGLF